MRSAAFTEAGSAVFQRIVVGVDGGEAALEGCRQALVLAEVGASIDVVTAIHLADASQAANFAVPVAEELRRRGDRAVAAAVEVLGPAARPHVVDGAALPVLLRWVAELDATVVVLGSRGHAYFTEVVFGDVILGVLRSAPCAVLVTRPAPPPAFPHAVVAGEGTQAQAVARRLAVRLGRPPAPPGAHGARPGDLLVLARRSARDSRVERAAFSAHCSVLVLPAEPL